jgi:RHS repeat-associated protein
VLNHIVYDSFGNVQSQTNGAINFRYGYTGRELDSETGLQYNRARYYDARTGQFIGQDPLSFGAGDTNLYRYVHNNPVNFTDPSGEFDLPTPRQLADTADNVFQNAVPVAKLFNLRPANTALDVVEGGARQFTPQIAPHISDAINKPRSVDLGEKAADKAADWYGERLYDPKTPAWQKPGLGLGLGLAGLWTTGSSNATVNTLICALGASKSLPKLGIAKDAPTTLYTYSRESEWVGNVMRTGSKQGRLWATRHGPGDWVTGTGPINTLIRAFRTGSRHPFKSGAKITGDAAKQFSPARAVGPFRGWKRLAGQYNTNTPGNLNLSTGKFLPATSSQKLWRGIDSATSYATDIAAVTSPFWVPPAARKAADMYVQFADR